MPKMVGVELTTSKRSNPQVVLVEKREKALIVMDEDVLRPSETRLLLRD